MLLLSQEKRPPRRPLGNAMLTTKARVTLVDAFRSAAVLIGLVLNAAADWWWADLLAGLVIVYYGIRETGPPRLVLSSVSPDTRLTVLARSGE